MDGCEDPGRYILLILTLAGRFGTTIEAAESQGGSQLPPSRAEPVFWGHQALVSVWSMQEFLLSTRPGPELSRKQQQSIREVSESQ
jgi:hypothetical protein